MIPHQFDAGRTGLLVATLLLVGTLTGLAGCGAEGKTSQQYGLDQAIPVIVSDAQAHSVPITIAAVGTFVAADSAAVRARVDGQLLNVAFKDGDEVKIGQVLFQLDERPYQAQLAQAVANRAKDQAALDRAHAQRLRYDNLVSKDYVSADDYAQIKANEETESAAVQADQALVDTARLNLNYCTIRAPISGRTGAAALRTGNLIKATDDAVLVTITRMDTLYADFSVAQQYLDQVRQAMQAKHATVTVATGAADATYAHASTLDFIDNTVDTSNGTIHVRATVDNQDRSLWPQQFIHVHLELAQSQSVLTVPLSAIGNGPEGSYVFVVDTSNHVHQRPITIERQTGGVAVISKGIAAGMPVVIDGQSRLQDNVKVVAQKTVAQKTTEQKNTVHS